MEEEKNYLAVLTETQLFPRIRLCDENDTFTCEMRQKVKDEMKETFIKECINIFKTMNEEQIREYVEFVLNRTINNLKKIKENRSEER